LYRLSNLHCRLLDDGEGGSSVELLVLSGDGGDGSNLPVFGDQGVSVDKLLVAGVEGVGAELRKVLRYSASKIRWV
jgi:hypothetical protein